MTSFPTSSRSTSPRSRMFVKGGGWSPTYNLGAADLADSVRERHRFDDAVMLGGYFTDFHGCPPTDEVSGYGLFEVPIGVFIPAQIDGFLPGIARAAGVSRVGSAAMQDPARGDVGRPGGGHHRRFGGCQRRIAS